MDNIGWTAPLAILAIFVALVGLAVLFMFARYFKLWLRGFVSRARIGPFALMGMSLRKVNPQVVAETKIMAVQAGLTDITTNAIEAHYLAGGNIRRVVQALIAAHRARIDLNWDTAAAIDLAGRNVLEAVQTSVDPKVIDCPDPRRTGRTTLDGVAKDGIQLKARPASRSARTWPSWSAGPRKKRSSPAWARMLFLHDLRVERRAVEGLSEAGQRNLEGDLVADLVLELHIEGRALLHPVDQRFVDLPFGETTVGQADREFAFGRLVVVDREVARLERGANRAGG